MSECAGVFGRIFGHRMRARVVESEREIPWNTEDELYKSCALISLGRGAIIRVERQYEGEVCTRCGYTPPRAASPGGTAP